LQTLYGFFLKLLLRFSEVKEWKIKYLQNMLFKTLIFVPNKEGGLNSPSNTCNDEMVYRWANNKRTVQQYKYGVIQRD
jgi:hypothetical protein